MLCWFVCSLIFFFNYYYYLLIFLSPISPFSVVHLIKHWISFAPPFPGKETDSIFVLSNVALPILSVFPFPCFFLFSFLWITDYKDNKEMWEKGRKGLYSAAVWEISRRIMWSLFFHFLRLLRVNVQKKTKGKTSALITLPAVWFLLFEFPA